MKFAWPWFLLSALVLAMQAISSGPIQAVLIYERDLIAAGEYWRLLTGQLIHVSWQHMLMNIAGLLCLGWIAWWLKRPMVFVVLGLSITVTLGLYIFNPAVGWYIGSSGMVHGGVAAALVFLYQRQKTVAVLLMLLLLIKLVLEQFGIASSYAYAVIVDAHLYGSVSGAVAALCVLMVQSFTGDTGSPQVAVSVQATR